MDHELLLRRLFLDGITGTDWMLLKNMYTDLTSVVKWEGTLASPFVIKQGVRHIRVPHVTVADDVGLLTNLTSEMQVMFHVPVVMLK